MLAIAQPINRSNGRILMGFTLGVLFTLYVR